MEDNFLKSLRYRIIDSLNHPSKIILGKERRSFATCPKDDLPASVKKRPTFRALSFCFFAKEKDQKQSELAYILGSEKRLVLNLFKSKAMTIKELLLLLFGYYASLMDMIRKRKEYPLSVKKSV